MCTFILNSYNQKSEIKNPHFFILNKGNNSGKPLVSPCSRCQAFVLLQVFVKVGNKKSLLEWGGSAKYYSKW